MCDFQQGLTFFKSFGALPIAFFLGIIMSTFVEFQIFSCFMRTVTGEVVHVFSDSRPWAVSFIKKIAAKLAYMDTMDSTFPDS